MTINDYPTSHLSYYLQNPGCIEAGAGGALLTKGDFTKVTFKNGILTKVAGCTAVRYAALAQHS